MKKLIDPINTADGLFHPKNKETGEKATIVTPDYMNDTQSATRINQQELIAILTAAGIAPDEASSNQVLTALKKLFLAIDNSRVSNSLQKGNNLSDVEDVATSRQNLELDNVGNYAALPLTGGTLTGIVTTSAEIRSTNGDNFRMVNGDRGIYWRLDANNLYLMITVEGDQFGSYNDARPIRVDLATGTVYINEAQPYSSKNPPPAPNLSSYIVGDACHQVGFISQNVGAPYLMFDGGTIVELAQKSWVNQNFLTSVRQASATWSGQVGGGDGLQIPAGCVVIGARNNGSSNVANMSLLYAAEQVFVNGNWVTIGLA